MLYTCMYMYLSTLMYVIISILIHYSGSNQLHLALLHSCELVVYLLSTEQNNEGPVYMLNLVYKHSLPRTACNMTWGPFGGNKGTVFTDYNRVPPPPPPPIIPTTPALPQQNVSSHTWPACYDLHHS
jgi:hypothetical protein